MIIECLRELKVDVDRVETEDEVDQHAVNALWHLLQESRSNLVLEGVAAVGNDGDQHLLGLLVDITDVDTTLVGEEDPVTLSGKVSGEIGE